MLKVKPQTAAEKKWIAELQAVLDRCPSKRVGAFTTGDGDITFYDRAFDGEICDLQNRKNCEFGAAVDLFGCGLGSVSFPFDVHSTAG